MTQSNTQVWIDTRRYNEEQKILLYKQEHDTLLQQWHCLTERQNCCTHHV